MSMSPPPSTAPALAALNSYPLLRASVAPGLDRQAVRFAGLPPTGVARSGVLEKIDGLVDALRGGVITLEGEPGSGISTLLAHYALTRPCVFWFADDDAGRGAEALYAQIAALFKTGLPLVPPALFSNPAALHTLLAEAAARRINLGSLVLVVDPPALPVQLRNPLPAWLPDQLPDNLVLIYGCPPATTLPTTWRPHARLGLERTGAPLEEQRIILDTLGVRMEHRQRLASVAGANLLLLQLAGGLVNQGLSNPATPPPNLDAAHTLWWESLSDGERQLAMLLAATAEPIPLRILAELLESDPLPTLERWSQQRFVQISREEAGAGAAWRHWYTSAYLVQNRYAEIEQAHAALAGLVQKCALISGDWGEGHIPEALRADPRSRNYLIDHFARHAALGPPAIRDGLLQEVAGRGWLRAHERRSNDLATAAHDAFWELRAALSNGPLLRLTRDAVLAGTLAAGARRLSGDAAIAALPLAQEQHGRENGLRRIVDLVEQMPDGQDKALLLRRIGEACYAGGMRSSAMRLLSRALDLEAQPFARAWREQREQFHATLAAAALELGAVEESLAICERISHLERRGMTETQVVRWLTGRGKLDHAELVARNIAHENHGSWARAEVAVALARTGRQEAAENLLSVVETETARAWALIELACDAARTDELAARAWIDRLGSPNQRDRGLSRLAAALAAANKDGDALAAVEQISDVEVRIAALLNLRLQLEGLVAMLALEQVTAAIDALRGDARVPLLADLAAAHASLGRRERAMFIAMQLNEGEERDRAFSRIAVAFARQGDFAQAREIVRTLGDDDEYDWALDELKRLLEEASRWNEAEALAREIRADDQRARTLADLAIARARRDDPLAALGIVTHITLPAEQSRALVLIAPQLVSAGQITTAIALASDKNREAAHLTLAVPVPTDTSRYLAAVAVALADSGNTDHACRLAGQIVRPLDRGRAWLAIARAFAPVDSTRAAAALGAALESAMLGRDEAFRLLEPAAPVLAQLGGADLLTATAAAVDEIDSWWGER